MKRALITAGVLFLVVLLAVGFVAYRFRRAFAALGKMPRTPDALRIARVVSGSDRFLKEAFYNEPDLGLITDIQEQPNHALTIVGQLGAAFLHGDGSFNRNVHFDRCTSDVVPVEVGAGAFLCRGAWSKGAMLIDSAGKTLWSYGGLPGVDDAAAGDLGADGSKNVVVGLNGGGGVRLLSSEGKELWKQDDGNVWHVEIAALEGRSDSVILHSNAKGQLTVRDASGKVVARYAPEVYLAKFSLSNWIDDPHMNKIVAVEGDSVYVLTTQGKTVARLPAPENAGIADPKGTRIDFSEGTPNFVSLLRHNLWTRSLLYIYDAQGHVVYDEVLDHDCDALHSIPGTNGVQDLLLGCDGIVWKYSLRR